MSKKKKLKHAFHFSQTGKHVLVEKPFSSNEKEAKIMLDTQMEEQKKQSKHLALVEAFHYRHHPLSLNVPRLMDTIGIVKSIKIVNALPSWMKKVGFDSNDIRFDYSLAGGVFMDFGCYAINMMRLMVESSKQVYGAKNEQNEEEIPQVVSAKAQLLREQVDHTIEADFFYSKSNIKVQMTVTFQAKSAMPNNSIEVEGEDGRLFIFNLLVRRKEFLE